MRKRILLLFAALALCLLLNAVTRAQPALRAPDGLLCELLTRPEKAVITDDRPEFGWIVNDRRRGARQAAYHILVASSLPSLIANRGDLWDSGKVVSAQSTDVEYNGQPLRSNASYWWKVRTYDAAGRASPWSAAQRFNTGDFTFTQRRWPRESRWVRLGQAWVFENRHPIEYHEIAPRRLVRQGAGHYFLDFGKAAFATLKLTLQSAADNQQVEIHLGEKLASGGGGIDRQPGGNIVHKRVSLTVQSGTREYTVALPRQRSNYPHSQTLAEHMPEVTPFRYAEIISRAGSFTLVSARQLALFYQFDEAASDFSSSSRELNQVWELCKYTLKATPFLGVYADGTRERMPYEADAYIQQLGHYAVDREYAIARYTHEFMLFNPSWPTEWHLHSVLIAWADYLQTGNRESLRRFYPELKAKTLAALARSDGLISTRTGLVTPEFLRTIHYSGRQFRDIVDWPQGKGQTSTAGEWTPPGEGGETDGFVFTDYNTVVNAFHYRALALMGEIATALGMPEEAQQFRNQSARVKQAFNAAFFNDARGVYTDGIGTLHSSLHANMFPLAFGLVPEPRLATVVAFIKSRGMACSVYGAQYLLEALYEAGEAQSALDLMTARSDRSWLHMLAVGSTMTLEAWDIKYKPNLDWNHAWGSAPANIIVRKLFGIEPLAPGAAILRIKPQPGNLQQARLKTPTIRGPVICDWQRAGDLIMFAVTIPANTNAQIHLPTSDPRSVRESGRPIGRAAGVKLLRLEQKGVVLEIGGGQYRFTAHAGGT